MTEELKPKFKATDEWYMKAAGLENGCDFECGMKEEIKPLPCPYCGGEVNVREILWDFLSIFCKNLCVGHNHKFNDPSNRYYDREKAIKMWNRRA